MLGTRTWGGRWKAHTNPLSYGGTPKILFVILKSRFEPLRLAIAITTLFVFVNFAVSLSLSWSSFFNLFSKHVSNAWREEFALLLIIQKLFFSFIWASFFTFQQILITSRRGIALKIQQTVNVASLSSIAQWIRLRLPSCHPGFKSQAHHLRFYHL